MPTREKQELSRPCLALKFVRYLLKEFGADIINFSPSPLIFRS
jgi:hypothetical protein